MNPTQAELEYSMKESLRDIALKQAAACARDRYPGEEKRWAKGLLIALNNKVMLGTDGIDRIQSDSNPEIFYEVRSGRCDCPDANNAPDYRCKHKIGAYLLRIAIRAMQQGR